MNKQTINKIAESLKTEGSFSIKGLGTFYKKPSRKGKINGTFGTRKNKKPKFKNRVSFVSDVEFKAKVNE